MSLALEQRKICIVTGSRAEYGLLRWLMEDIRDDARLELQIVATGMHFAPEFGETYKEIEAGGFTIDARVDLQLSGDSAAAVTRSLGRGVIGFADVLERLRPDLMVVLGDRFEILAAAQAAMMARIPIAHIHGGELTLGAVDDAIRHAITKMAHLHFAAAEPYRRRIIQMGENPDRVFTVGAPGADNVKWVEPLDRRELFADLGIKHSKPCFLVTFHPETLAEADKFGGVGALLAALAEFDQSQIIFTGVNADAGGHIIAEAISRFVADRPGRAVLHASLGQRRYLSALTNADAVIGNSSSGIIEAPAVGVPTVNIGDRQKGRLRSQSVIDCANEKSAIVAAIHQALTDDFRELAKTMAPAYGAGNAAQRICEILATCSSSALERKVFYDLA